MTVDHPIRRAQLADAPALARLGEETFIETFVEGFAVPYPPDDLAEDLIDDPTDSGGAAPWDP